MTYGDRQMDALVDEIALSSKDDYTKQVHYKVVVDKFEQRLRQDGLPVEVRTEMLRRIAEAETKRYFNRRKPKPGPQAAFYQEPAADQPRRRSHGRLPRLTHRRVEREPRQGARLGGAERLRLDGWRRS